MDQGMNIPGLFLSNTTDPVRPATGTSASLPFELPPATYSISDAGTLRQAMQVLSNGPTTSNDIMQQPLQQLTSAVTADESDDSKEDGELTDVSVDILPTNSRKRKAGGFIDNDRSYKVQASYIDPPDPQGQHAMHVVSTLLENGFPLDQLVQDIYGITLARRHQTHSVAARVQNHAVSATDGFSQGDTPAVNTAKAQSGADAGSNTSIARQYVAKPATRDPLAYKARLESLKKTPQPSKSKPVPIKAAASKLDRERLKAKIAALRAEHASKSSISPSVQKDGTVSASPGLSPIGNASPSSALASSKARMTALDLIESSNGSEHSLGPDKTNFKSPMGVDQEDSMVIEASSSEDEDEEDEIEAEASDKSSDKLVGLESGIALMKAQLAARLLKRRQQSSPLPTQNEPEKPPLANATLDLLAADTAALRQDVQATSQHDEHIGAPNPLPEPISKGMADSNAIEQASELLVKTEVEMAEYSSAQSQDEIIDEADEEEEEDEDEASDDDDDDAPMSIDSGSEPTPVLEGHEHSSIEGDVPDSSSVASDGSASMDISGGSSDGDSDEAAEDSEFDTGLEDQVEEESEEDYEPERASASEVAEDVINEQDQSPTPSNASSRSQSPNDTWRKHPPTSNDTGITIWHESGATPELPQVTPLVPKTSNTPFVPYESKLRFKREELIINPSP